MRVFVTGGTGFIGGHIVKALRTAGMEVTVLTRDTATSMADVAVVRGDLSETESWRGSLAEHDALIHNAIVWDEEPTELELKDPRASVSLYQEAAAAGIGHVVYTSSVAVHRPFVASMNVDTPLRPTDFYGATKAVNEILLFACADQFGFRANIVRPGPTVGAPLPGGRHASDRRITEIVNKALAGEVIVVQKGDGRQFTSVEALAQVYCQLLLSELNREVFIVCDPEPTTWETVSHLAIDLTSSASQVRIEVSDGTPTHFDVSKLQRLLNVQLSGRRALQDHLKVLSNHH